MLYTIPKNKIETLESIIKRYQKKGGAITFRIGDEVVEEGTLYITDSVHHCSYKEKINIVCKQVYVDGSYKINDWEFIGTIEFTENGNIIRLAQDGVEVPEKYLHTKPICEHCGTIRNRKDTYLIRNTKTGEFKQVGSRCLLDYTKGLDANECASIMSCLEKFVELTNKDIDSSEFMQIGYDSIGYSIDRYNIIRIAYAYVKQYGYQKMENGCGTAYDIMLMLAQGGEYEEMQRRFNSLVMPTDAELKIIDDIAKANIDSLNNDYMRNASLAWLKSSIEYRDFSLIASFINRCLKDVAEKIEKENNKANVWVGEIGERITFKVNSARVLYTKDNSYYSYYANCSYVMELIDTEGHTYKWSSSTNNINEGDIITATVKEHSEYRGTKQTVITRGKVNK